MSKFEKADDSDEKVRARMWGDYDHDEEVKQLDEVVCERLSYTESTELITEPTDNPNETKMTGAYVRQRLDSVLYDTRMVEPGQRTRFFGQRQDFDIIKSNMFVAGGLEGDKTAQIVSIGLRFVSLSQDEESRLLDRLQLDFLLGDRVYGQFPGACLGTRYRPEVPVLKFWETMRARTSVNIDAHSALRYSPGYVLKRPIILPCRQNFSAFVQAAGDLPRALPVQVMLFSIVCRDV